MMTTKAQSCVKRMVSFESGMLHIMSRGMKTSRDRTATGNRRLSLDGCTNISRVSQKSGGNNKKKTSLERKSGMFFSFSLGSEEYSGSQSADSPTE